VKRFRIVIADKSYNVEVGDPQKTPLTVTVDGETFSIDMQPLAEEAKALSTVPDQAPASGTDTPKGDGFAQVKAPMPGKVLDIAVMAGDRVQQDQVLCALEAMKMKSPIRAPRAGTVRQVQVHDGQNVDYGDLLFVLG
jgi:acetyl-CoA/propionyl-CoA carboxylase biotin carboxyl carrier protein